MINKKSEKANNDVCENMTGSLDPFKNIQIDLDNTFDIFLQILIQKIKSFSKKKLLSQETIYLPER